MSKPKILVITGPTAVGKTALSIDLAETFNGEIINGDAMQIYKELQIGTAKPTAAEQAAAPHHLINIRSVSENYSAAAFKADARKIVTDLVAKQRLPIAVGGTGLYLETFLYDLSLGGKVEPHPEFRQEMARVAAETGPMKVYEKLKVIDPVAAKTVHPNNVRRVIRMLEVCQFSDQLFSEQNETHQQHKSPYDLFFIALTTERELLYSRINQRVDQMVIEGLFTEAEWLFKQKLPHDSQSLQAIGYKELFPYFEGKMSKADVIERLKRDSRRYAKRQLTWIRNRLDSYHEVDLVQFPEQQQQLEADIKEFLTD